jgi:hypothetical protein
MKFKNSENRSVPLGKMLLFCCITLGLIAVFSVAVAQETISGKSVTQGAEWGNYANFSFSLPEQVEVVGDTMEEANYTSGRELTATMLLDGKIVGLHILYPCQAPERELERADLKPYLEAFNPIFAQATYNESVPGPVLLGQIGNQNFITYQPNNLTVALVMMDVNMSASMVGTLLDNLKINVNEGVTPPGNCQDSADTVDTTVAPAVAAVQNTTSSQATDNEIAPAEAEVQNTASSQVTDKELTPAERMKANQERLKAQMNERRKKFSAS